MNRGLANKLMVTKVVEYIFMTVTADQVICLCARKNI